MLIDIAVCVGLLTCVVLWFWSWIFGGADSDPYDDPQNWGDQ